MCYVIIIFKLLLEILALVKSTEDDLHFKKYPRIIAKLVKYLTLSPTNILWLNFVHKEIISEGNFYEKFICI